MRPTIGIEIELPWGSMLSRVDPEAAAIFAGASSFYNLTGDAKARVQQGFDAVDAQYKETVDSVFGDDIYPGNDGYREFAFEPVHDYQRLVEIAEDLYEQSILLDDERYSLHVTLGGIAAKNSSWLILMAAEICGGASSERLTQTDRWSRKGSAGIRERTSRKLKLGANVGVEMRSLEVSGTENLQSTLSLVQNLGELFLRRSIGDLSAERQWEKLQHLLMTRAEDQGVDARVRWPNPQRLVEPWQQFAEAIANESWRQSTEEEIHDLVV